MESKKQWHLTITNNETGEVLRDLDTCAIIGACDVDENTTACLSLLAGSALDVFATLETAEDAIKGTYTKYPQLLTLKRVAETTENN